MGLDNFPLQEAKINATLAGDNILVVGIPGRTIRVFRLALVVSDAVLLDFKDGPTSLTGDLSMTAHGSIVFDFDGEHWFITSDGNDFILSMSAPVPVNGRLYYTQSAEVF